MSIRYSEIGQRLRAFRMGSGLSAEQIARRIGISRTALYRLEKGEVVKIETLTSLSELLGVSLPTLLGVEIEYISSAVTYFERLRQLEEDAERIFVLAGPISFLLSSPQFEAGLEPILLESVPDNATDREKTVADIHKIMEILAKRRRVYEERRPSIVNLISALDIERLLRSGFVGRPFVTAADIRKRRERARAEIEHFAAVVEAEPIGVQIGLVTDSLPHTAFQIFRNGDKKTLSISPFRLGEQPNVRLGVAMITSSNEAVDLHEKVVTEMWRAALKGRDAAAYLRELLDSTASE
ncbi:helix-turn-helix domain-containing protein [Amorphus sp. 3PC139-8]|uniref:helix-turn-helix domain-containing protein n=1 Tax=Amorphus sp. 3PC139-8 TaxID=2735676 RepID=UPI00345D6FA1